MELKQKIHDALLMELIKKDDDGNFSNLLKLVNDKNFSVKCSVDVKGKGCVDLVLKYPKKFTSRTIGDGLFILPSGTPDVAFELITDINFDAGKKLEQVNRYKLGFSDVRVIIPEEYIQYSQLFELNEIKVHTWNGTRKWKGKYCEHITEVKNTSRDPLKCRICNKNGLFFIGFNDDVTFK